MRYSPVFVEQIVQFAFSNVEREIADENGRHDVVVVDDDAELAMGFARLFIQKRRQQYVNQHRQKQDPPPRRRPLCEKGLSQSMCVLCVLCDDDDVVISLSFRSNVFYTILVQKFLKKDQTHHHDENKGSRENTNKTTLKEDKHHHYKYYTTS